MTMKITTLATMTMTITTTMTMTMTITTTTTITMTMTTTITMTMSITTLTIITTMTMTMTITITTMACKKATAQYYDIANRPAQTTKKPATNKRPEDQNRQTTQTHTDNPCRQKTDQ